MSKRLLKVKMAYKSMKLRDGYISLDDITMLCESNIDDNHSIVVIDGCEYIVYKKLSELEQFLFNEIESILITEELLLKNGFEQYEYIFKASFIEMYEVENGWHLHIDNEKFETAIALTIKYVHQLQNAYYLATGKELEIKL